MQDDNNEESTLPAELELIKRLGFRRCLDGWDGKEGRMECGQKRCLLTRVNQKKKKRFDVE